MKKMPGIILSLSMSTILLCHCTNPSKPATAGATVLLNKMDSEYVKIADLQVAQIKAADKAFGVIEKNKYSEAVRQYEAAGIDINKKASIFWDKFSKDDDPRMQQSLARAEAAADRAADRAERRAATGGAFIPVFNVTISDNKFDLAIGENEYAIQQVQMLNGYYGDAGKETLDAINYYNKLTKEEKTKLMSSTALTPFPDYQRYIGQQLQRIYLLQQLRLQNNISRFLTLRLNRYVNEFPQGFKNGAPAAAIHQNDKIFDLKSVASNERKN